MRSRRAIHVVDDDPGVREALGMLLRTEGYEARVYESAAAFLDAIGRLEPGCVVTDVRMPGLSGLDLLAALKDRGAPMPVIIITGHGDVPLAVEAMKQGAVDFLEKPFESDALLAAVEAALSRGRDAEARDDETRRIAEKLATLSAREFDVLAWLVRGKPNKVIAYEMGIGRRTVETHRANVMAKMGARSLSELVRMALAVSGDVALDS